MSDIAVEIDYLAMETNAGCGEDQVTNSGAIPGHRLQCLWIRLWLFVSDTHPSRDNGVSNKHGKHVNSAVQAVYDNLCISHSEE